MTCRELVDSLADYLSAEESSRLLAECEAHLAECGDCRTFLKNYQATIGFIKQTRQADHDSEEV